MGFKYVQSSELHQGERLGPRRPANPPHVVNTQVLEEQTWRNRDEPRGISHTAEWTGLNGLSELTPQGRGRRQRGLGFFFPLDGEYWHTGDTGERAGRRAQERDVASQGRPGASGRESSRIPTTGRGGRGGPLVGEQERWAGLRWLSAEKCSGDLVWPDLQRNPCNKVTQHKQSKKPKAERKGGGNCSSLARPRNDENSAVGTPGSQAEREQHWVWRVPN